ncbi:TPA: hypothetical protein ACJJSN_000282 [Neisseria meningitidis]
MPRPTGRHRARRFSVVAFFATTAAKKAAKFAAWRRSGYFKNSFRICSLTHWEKSRLLAIFKMSFSVSRLKETRLVIRLASAFFRYSASFSSTIGKLLDFLNRLL